MVNYFGLYVGNSTASIAVFKEDGKVEVLANEAGDRVTATVVAIANDEKVVGSTAAVTSYALANSSINYNKRLLDPTVDINSPSFRPWGTENNVKIDGESPSNFKYLVTDDDPKKPTVCTLAQIATLIFKKLYGIGSGAAPGQKSYSCVIAVPKHWDAASRRLTADAAIEAGWDVLQIINEPASALLAYQIGFEQPSKNQIALVYRLGGLSCDATVVSVDQGLQIIISHVKNANLGGQDIIDLVTDHLCDEFKRKYYLDPKESRKAMWKLRVAATAIIHTLSTVPSSSRFIESVCEGVDFNPTISQARFEALLQPLLPKLIAPIHDALKEASIEGSQVSKVVLCGGGLKGPKIRSVVSSLFSCDVCSGLNPDEVLASGAAQQAGLIGDRRDIGLHVTKATKHVPFLDHPLHIKVNEEEIILDHGVMPITQKKKITLDDPKVVISAKQERELPLKSFSGEGFIECAEEGDVEVDLRLTTDNELIAEVTQLTTKELEQTTIELVPCS